MHTPSFTMSVLMSLSKQAKTLTKPQIKLITGLIQQTRYPVRNQAIFLLSVRAGLRAKEIASLTWDMVTDELSLNLGDDVPGQAAAVWAWSSLMASISSPSANFTP